MKTTRFSLFLLILLALPFSLTARAQAGITPATAQAAASETTPPSAANDAAQAPPKSAAVATVKADASGFGFSSPAKDFTLNLRGDLQADSRFFTEDEVAAGSESFYLRRVRLSVQGTLYERFDFRIMPNFGLGRAELQDAYLDARFAPQASVRFGKFKTPAGLEFLQSPNSSILIERGFPTGLVPNRDVGFELRGDLAGKRFSYAIGAFNGSLDGASIDADLDNNKDFMLRLFTHPFAGTESALKGLGFGVATTTGTREGVVATPNLTTYRTSGRQTFFRYRTAADEAAFAQGRNTRIIPQGYLYAGPFGLLAEYAVSKQEVATDSLTANLQNRAWQVATSIALTGEDASYGMLKPAKPFGEPGNWGAFELTARVQGITIDDASFPVFASPDASASGALAWGVGINWYLNASVRFMVNYEQTTFDAAAGAETRPTEHLVLTRFQIAF
jgi:phosphate-selective porin OprO and OprP